MDISKLKNLVKQNGDKFVLVENGEPEIVMMSFHEYQKILARDSSLPMRSNQSYDDLESFELNLPETELMLFHEVEAPGLPVRLEDIRLDDLPI